MGRLRAGPGRLLRSWPARALAVLAGLLLLEGGLRLTRERKLREKVWPPIYQFDPVSGYRYVPGAEGFMCLPAFCRQVHINGNGYSGAAFSLAKPPGTFRVAVVMMSVGVSFWTEDGEGFIEMLGQDLRRRSSRIEVLNFSMDGRERYLENLELVKTEVLRYSPDLVILETKIPLSTAGLSRKIHRGYVINYPADSPHIMNRTVQAIDRLEQRTWLKRVYRASYLFRTLYGLSYKFTRDPQAYLLLHRRYDYYKTFQEQSVPHSIAALQEAQRLLAARGARLLAFTWTWETRSRALALANDIDVIAVEYPPKPHRIPSDSHPDRRGHGMIKDQLVREVLARLPPGVLEAR